MIKAFNLNKYFFKRKKNEIHVINNVSIELPEKGLVVLFGPSGGGKTTLLNVLGGLDKAEGTINFFDHEFDKYKMGKWDKLRTYDIGYVFQNYLLVEELSVYENIKLTLDMIGMTDKDMIDNRIEYVLESVGLKNYKRRRASQLSGGQQQRVAIARALAKNPKVIIADEPTGNLDSKNTVEIMNIIKTISKDKLVLLVTHEKDVANYYADRIIEIKDGQMVSDTENTGDKTFNYAHETDIYLKDLPVQNLANDNVDVSFYGEFSDKKIRLISKSGTIYVDLGDSKERVVVLDSNSETKIYDQSAKDFKSAEKVEFDYDKYYEPPKHKKYRAFIPLKRAFKLAFNQLVNFTRRRRFLLIGFLFAGALIAVMTSLLILATDDRNTQLSKPIEVIDVQVTGLESKDITEAPGFVTYLPSYFSFEFAGTVFDQNIYGSHWDSSAPRFSGNIIFNGLRKPEIVYGRSINEANTGEILIDTNTARSLISNTFYAVQNFKERNLIGEKFKFNELEVTIVGITNHNYNYITMEKEDFINYQIPKDASIYNQYMGYTYQQKLTYYESTLGSRSVYSTTPELAYNYYIGDDDKNPDVSAFWTYPEQKEMLDNALRSVYQTIFTVIIIAAGLTWLSLYFIIRSNLFSRIDEIKVYRALGVRWFEIVKIFAVEVFVLTTISTVVGYIITTIYMGNMDIFKSLNMVTSTLPSSLLAILIIYVFNLLFGTLPVILLMRRTPAGIIAQAEA